MRSGAKEERFDVSCIYIIGQSKKGPFKIGRSKNIKITLCQLQRGNPQKLFCFLEFEVPKEYAQKIESWAHYRLLDKKSIGGDEWFQVSFQAAKKAVQKSLQETTTPPDCLRARRCRERWEDPNWARKQREKLALIGKERWAECGHKLREGLAEWLKCPKNIAKRRATMQKTNENPEVVQKRKEGAKRMWADPEYRKRKIEIIQKINKETWSNPEFKKKKSAEAKARWEQPDYREKMIKTSLARWTPEARKIQSELFKKVRNTPEFKKQSAEYAKKRWDRPGEAERMSKLMKEIKSKKD